MGEKKQEITKVEGEETAAQAERAEEWNSVSENALKRAREFAEPRPLPRLTEREKRELDERFPKREGRYRRSKLMLEAKEREQRAVALRLEGYTYPEIGKILDVHTATARRYVQGDLHDRQYQFWESKRELRQLMLMRLEAMWKGLQEEAYAGNVKSVRVALRLFERQSRLQGLDAPSSGRSLWITVLQNGEVSREDLFREAVHLLQRGEVLDAQQEADGK